MYGESAKIPERRDISYIRNMHFQYEELKQHILEEKLKVPDKVFEGSMEMQKGFIQAIRMYLG